MFKLKAIFHMNGYPEEICYNHVKKFHGDKQRTTNGDQNMNDAKKYTVIMQFIGHPSLIFKKTLAKNFKSITKKCCTISKTF